MWKGDLQGEDERTQIHLYLREMDQPEGREARRKFQTAEDSAKKKMELFS